MKKGFYIATIIECLMATPFFLVQVKEVRFRLLYKEGLYTTFDLISDFWVALFFVTLVPIISLIIAFYKDKKETLSKTYMVTFLVINSIITIISFFYFLVFMNFSM